MKEQQLNFANFTRVKVKHAIEVEVVRSDAFTVGLTVENFNVKDVVIAQEEDKLTIGRRRLSIRTWFAAPAARVKVRIAMPDLSELTLSGASHGFVRGFSSQRGLNVFLSGASHMDLVGISAGHARFELSGASRLGGTLNAETAEFKVKGASNVKLGGSANGATIEASGASRLELDGFRTQRSSVTFKGASYGTANVDGRLDAQLSGASRLLYTGNTTLGSVSTSGASSLGAIKEAVTSSPQT